MKPTIINTLSCMNKTNQGLIKHSHRSRIMMTSQASTLGREEHSMTRTSSIWIRMMKNSRRTSRRPRTRPRRPLSSWTQCRGSISGARTRRTTARLRTRTRRPGATTPTLRTSASRWRGTRCSDCSRWRNPNTRSALTLTTWTWREDTASSLSEKSGGRLKFVSRM